MNPLQTRLTKVKDIPYFVTNKFLRTYNRNAYQLGQVERMVEAAYENYLVKECNKQKSYKKSLEKDAKRLQTDAEKERALRIAGEFELSRCMELNDLFPRKVHASRSYN